jgi:hypothetical protein
MEPTRSRDDLAAAVRELAAADTVAFGGVGFAARILPATEAYWAIEEVLPNHVDELQPQLARLLADGTPAGKAFAATLLGRFDQAAARAAWESLTGDGSELRTFDGCVMARTTLGEYAKRQLAQPAS